MTFAHLGPGTVQSGLYILTCLISTTVPQNRGYDDPNFTSKETEAQSCIMYPGSKSKERKNWSLPGEMRLDESGVGLVQLLRECSGD